jgi:predicted kinase
VIVKQALILIRGLPGSGKSTLAQRIFYSIFIGIPEPNGQPVWFEADHFMVDDAGNYQFKAEYLKEAHKCCQDGVKNALSKGQTAIVSNTFTQHWEMQPYFDLAKEFNIPVQVIECKANFGSIHGVPPEKVEQMRQRWEHL